MARIVSWHFPEFFFLFCFDLGFFTRIYSHGPLAEKEVCGFSTAVGEMERSYRLESILLQQPEHMHFAVASKPLMHSVTSYSTSPFNKWSWWEFVISIIPQPMWAIPIMQKKEDKRLPNKRFYIAYVFRIKRKMLERWNYRREFFLMVMVMQSDRGAYAMFLLNGLLDFFLSKGIKTSRNTHAHIQPCSPATPLWFSTQTKTATAKLQTVSGE